jgi:hypothetical protein
MHLHTISLHIDVSWEIWSKGIYEQLQKKKGGYALIIISKENKMMQKSNTFTTILHVKSATFITICKK